MPNYDFWQYVLSPRFLITFGLVMAGFLPVAYSVFVTWEENREKAVRLEQRVREERRARRNRRTGTA